MDKQLPDDTAMHHTKKLINSVERCVDESIEGFVTVNTGLRTLAGYPKIVVREDIDLYIQQGKVTTVTGGGSGHEPCFMGYVGEGMMSAAVHGTLFASPAPTTILAALRLLGTSHPAGVLMVFNNYTGDRLNFGLAMERARAEGIRVEAVINADDCAVSGNDKTAGRRGLAGLVLLMKIVGCMAETGEPLDKIVRTAKEAAAMTASMGVCWSPCSLPGEGLLFQLGPTEMEIGLGMHGEAGVKRVQMQSCRDTVKQLVDSITDPDMVPVFIQLNKGDKIAVLLNNLGSASDIEMNIAAHETITYLEQTFGVLVTRAYVGKYVTSQEMAGLSITIMILSDHRAFCLDAKTKAVSWIKPMLTEGSRARITPAPLKVIGLDDTTNNVKTATGPVMSPAGVQLLCKAVTSACNNLIANAELLNRMDSGSGDGDCGSSLAEGAKAILHKVSSTEFNAMTSVCGLLLELAEAVERSMGGCSGALYSILLTSVAQQMAEESAFRPNPRTWIKAFKRGIDTICRYGGAQPGDRTMLDPLNAAYSVLEKDVDRTDIVELLQSAAKAADSEAKNTKNMLARAGRASYVNKDQLVYPDPGAKACAIWFQSIVNILCDNRKMLIDPR